MDAIFVGIDVSKDRLDVHVRPSGEAFVVTRDGKGLEELVGRLQAGTATAEDQAELGRLLASLAASKSGNPPAEERSKL